MDLRTHLTVLTRLLTILLSALAPMKRVLAENFGKVGAVNQDAIGTPPEGSAHTLVVGAGVVYKENIQTSAQGSTQILFPDQSTLNIGRNSSLVIDEYVYDPQTNQGSMLASLTKGTMRFVGGQISHSDGVTVNTPVATLGIRGGVATVVYPISPKLAASDPNLAGCSGQMVIGHVGTLTLKNAVSEVTVRPGFCHLRERHEYSDRAAVPHFRYRTGERGFDAAQRTRPKRRRLDAPGGAVHRHESNRHCHPQSAGASARHRSARLHLHLHWRQRSGAKQVADNPGQERRAAALRRSLTHAVAVVDVVAELHHAVRRRPGRDIDPVKRQRF